MRICLIAEEYWRPNHGGGIGTYTHTLAGSLASLGHEIHIVTGGTSSVEYEQQGVKVHQVPRARLLKHLNGRIARRLLPQAMTMLERAAGVRSAVRRIERRYGLDIVEAPEWGAESLLLPGAISAPVIVRFHGPRAVLRSALGDRRLIGDLVAEALERAAVLRANATSAPCHAVVARYAELIHNGDLRRSTEIIPNPIDTTAFVPTTEISDPLTVTFVGKLNRLKGIETLAAAFQEISARHPRARLQIIGADNGWPGHRSAVKWLQSQFPVLKTHATFVGAVSPAEIPEFLRGTSISVVPSHWETFPYTCLEAMACGTALVGSAVGAMPEIITDHWNGRLFPANCPASLAAVVDELLSDAEQRILLANNARKFVCERLDSAIIARQMVEFYAKVHQSGATRANQISATRLSRTAEHG